MHGSGHAEAHQDTPSTTEGQSPPLALTVAGTVLAPHARREEGREGGKAGEVRMEVGSMREGRMRMGKECVMGDSAW